MKLKTRMETDQRKLTTLESERLKEQKEKKRKKKTQENTKNEYSGI